MNIRARRMTFCETWVVDKIDTTHFRKPIDGIASDARGSMGAGVVLDSST